MSSISEPKADTGQATYWHSNLKIMAVLLSIWFFVSFGCGILFASYLDQFHFFGFKLGYWFAHQGAIFIFVILIFIYAALMNRLDERYKNHELEARGRQK